MTHRQIGDTSRVIRAPRGTKLSCRSWLTEAAFRMIQHNLDPDVAENPAELVVYGRIGRAARNWECFDAILATLKRLGDDETLLVQSGKPVAVFKTHPDAPRVLIANSNLVPAWATWDHFNELDRKGLMMYGQMTAGSWIYIASQGIVQGTYETFAEALKQHYGGAAGKWVLTAGLGGRGAAARARGEGTRLRGRARQRRGRRAGNRAARHPARPRDRPDFRPRPRIRLLARGLDRRAVGARAEGESQVGGGRGAAVHRPPR